ncbi:MAG: hypothetical protein A2589_03080 [Candidatus Vogelbacteria bacterium RIFOXYD1_FULL_46_19]|uniref:Uncharacterized protein n=1 Tax=Candidatus Vogelbacteria bacterium RIFOXYD1_FULL_46_19 TaxID=1802439 RepID=A0A1G2QHA7_9BACT|nr:MAG: hypothetical protein A2589_03080 [Candidatus Vogelbacteria bacterium RIFOXYD1_FULL_46_19]
MKVLLVVGLVALLAFALVLAIGPPALAGTQAVPVVVAKVAPLGAWAYSSIEEGETRIFPSDSLLVLAIFQHGSAEHLSVEISTSSGSDFIYSFGASALLSADYSEKVEVTAPGASRRALAVVELDCRSALVLERRVMARALA